MNCRRVTIYIQALSQQINTKLFKLYIKCFSVPKKQIFFIRIHECYSSVLDLNLAKRSISKLYLDIKRNI
jgi:hypothetical protein